MTTKLFSAVKAFLEKLPQGAIEPTASVIVHLPVAEFLELKTAYEEASQESATKGAAEEIVQAAAAENIGLT